MDLQDLVNDILRKIGRNMMLFQELEHLLKYVIAYGNISGNASELEDIQVKQVEAVRKQTMGQLVGQFIENSHSESSTNFDESEELNEDHFSINFRIETTPERYAEKKESLERLVNERNELVHHLLPRFNTKSKASCDELSKQLDHQSDVVRHEVKELRSSIAVFRKGLKYMASFYSSDEGKKQIERDYLRRSKLASLLIDIADQLGKEDGWISISLAANLVRQYAPEEFERLPEIYGFKTLKRFMIATQLFEFKDEKTPKGGMRALYRLIPVIGKNAELQKHPS